MRDLIVLIMFGVLWTGCSDEVWVETSVENECFETVDRERLAKFIINCSKAANPLSDEEGEDLVAQCERTGTRTFCPPHKFCRMRIEGGFPTTEYASTSWDKDCDAAQRMVDKEKKRRGL